MTPEEMARIDQSSAVISDILPPMWRRLYNNLISEGFNETQAFKLVQTYILSQCPNGIRGDDG